MSSKHPEQSPDGLAYAELKTASDSGPLAELQRRMPDGLAELVRQRMGVGRKIIFSFPVDMNLLGRYAQEWVVITDRRCMTWAEGEDGYDARADFALDELKAVRLRQLTGNHILLVERGKGWEEVARSSNLTSWKLKPTLQVLEKVAEDGVTVMDDVGQIELKLPERQVCPKCGRILRPRVGTCLACLNKRGLIVRMLKLVLPYKWVFVGVLGLLVIISGLELMAPLIMRSILDLVLVPAVGGDKQDVSFWYRMAEPGTIEMLLILSGAWLALITMPAIIQGVQRYATAWMGGRVVVDLSNSLFAHMMRLSLSFYHREETGRAMSRITRDVDRIHSFVTHRLQALLHDVLVIVFIIVIMVTMHWKLALLSLGPIPLLIVLSEVARRKIHGTYHVLFRRQAAVSRFLAGTIPGIRVVKAFAQGPREVRRFRGLMRGVFRYRMKAIRVLAILMPALHMTVRFGGLFVYAWGGVLLIRSGGGDASGLTVGTIGAFAAYMWRFYMPVLDLAHMLPEFERAATSAERVFEVLDSEPELDSDDRVVGMPRIKGRVEFKDVTFGYEPDKPVLTDMSFVIAPGEMIGLVGHSGAGKTTLINLICHFFKTDEGQVLVDGIDLPTVNVESLRSQIGIVSQEPFLFSGTIWENIGYSKPGANDVEIIAAAKAANAHEFILDFPEGYDTMVGERGVRISGGERQRIAIARAILKDPRILILDEATSSVDTETEEKIQAALRRLVAGRTTFAIAHRLSTLKFANRLLVLEHGRLVESGSHDELVALKGVYATLCEKQTRLSRITAWQQ